MPLDLRIACLLLAGSLGGCGARSELSVTPAEGPTSSCAAIHAAHPALPSGAYDLDTDGVRLANVL